jgi:molybdenum cofactor guanylyltransferase
MIKTSSTAIILAGGKSLRMGADKCMLPIEGKPLIAYVAAQLTGTFDEVLIGSNQRDRFRFMGLTVVPDIKKNIGPLMGIYSCLKASSNALNFVTACDIPFMNIALIKEMLSISDNYDAVIPVTTDQHLEPLFAVYNRSAIPFIETMLMQGCNKVARLPQFANVHLIPVAAEGWYNLNQKADYERFIKSQRFNQ